MRVNGEQGCSRALFTVYCLPFRLIFPAVWTGVRVAEGAGLENRYTLTGIVGSNPTLSVLPCPTWSTPDPESKARMHLSP